MNTLKLICFVALMAIAFSYCTEIYQPDITPGTEALVVEGLITNEQGPYVIKLSMAKPLPFDSTGVTKYTVRDAKVTIIENQNIIHTLTEPTPGYYSTEGSFTAQIGNTYKLRIQTKKGVIYESKSEKLLAPQEYDSIHAYVVQKNYINWRNEYVNVLGADVRVDIFKMLSKLDSVPACRFSSLLTFQYHYTYRDRDINGNEIMTYHWENFGWETFKINSIENISEEKLPSSTPEIRNHSIGFVPYDAWSYNLVMPSPDVIYYIRLDQFTLNHDSYRFYKGANSQLSSSGRIFDPITSQLFSNIRCLSNSSKIALGLFEVSSVKKQAFVVEVSNYQKTVSVRNAYYLPSLPKKEFHTYRVWEAMSGTPEDSSYNYVPYPEWWQH